MVTEEESMERTEPLRGLVGSGNQRRKRRAEATRQWLVSSMEESLFSVEHDSAALMVVTGEVGGKRCDDILVDPGASSNFVRRDWAMSLSYPVQELKTPLEVTLADGRVVGRQTGCIRVSAAQTQGSVAPCTLIVMDRLSHHVILGKPWLDRAGVKLEFGSVTRWNGKSMYRLKMRGDSGPRLHAIKVASGHESLMTPVLAEFEPVFRKGLSPRSADALRNAVHCTVKLKDPNCRPVVSRERRRSPKDVQTLIDAVKEMEAAGLIQKSDSPWSSQAVLVRKVRDGVELDEKRPCWDLRAVNERIISDAHPLPLPEDLFDKLRGCRLFSKLDLTKGFWQIPMDEASKKILAMATPLGLYEPNSMPFGMKNAPAIFQREMQRVLRDRLYQGVMVFIDDILIYSKTEEEHLELVRWVLRRLQEEGYYANPDKCEFFQREVSFLGHVVSECGVAVQEHKVRVVADWPQPRNKKDVRAFLGLTGYYRKFISEYSEIAVPLTDLTRDAVNFDWTEREQGAFELLKMRLTTADVLAHPDPAKPYIITTDASGFAVSGVLSQDQDDGSRRPLAYMSRKMSERERRWPTHDKELLAILTAVELWRCYVEGSPHPVVLLSDHRSLQHLNSQPRLSDRQARWVEKLSDFEFAIKYVPGSVNVVADALSRRPDYEEEAAAERAADVQGPVEEQPRIKVNLAAAEGPPALWQVRIAEIPLREEMKAAAQRDPVYQELLARPEPRTDGLIVGDGLLWTCDGLFYVPDDLELRRKLIHEVHDTPIGGHSGLAKTLARLTTSCYWWGMKRMIADYVRGCITCAAVKPDLKLPAGLLRPLPIPDKPWRVITIDFVGPLPRTPDYYNYILVMQDKFSKRCHFAPTTTNVTAKETTELLLRHVVRLHGLPEAIISDRGHEFTAHLFQEVWKAMGTELRMSTAYHPQSDGGTERLIRELELQLRSFANREGTNWNDRLPIVEMHYNSTVHASTGKTPYEMDGVDWRDQWALTMQAPASATNNDQAKDLLTSIRTTWEDARQVMIKMREQQRKYADKRRRDERYELGDQVMLRTENLAVGRGKLSDRWVGPFRVSEVRDNGVNVRLELPDEYSRIHDVFHVEKLKRFVPSSIDWPGRTQPPRPKATLVDGKKKWWALRILGKKMQEVEYTVREEIKEVQAAVDGLAAEVSAAQLGQVQPKRVSPRLHASSQESAVLSKPRRKRWRNVKHKRMVIYYQVEWEGFGLEDATWEPMDKLVEQGLQWMIDDYELLQRRMDDEADLGTQYNFAVTGPINGVAQLLCMQV